MKTQRLCDMCGKKPALSRRRAGKKGKNRKALIEVKYRKGHDLCQQCFDKLLDSNQMKGSKRAAIRGASNRTV